MERAARIGRRIAGGWLIELVLSVGDTLSDQVVGHLPLRGIS
jgi:hypothetical protein